MLYVVAKLGVPVTADLIILVSIRWEDTDAWREILANPQVEL